MAAPVCHVPVNTGPSSDAPGSNNAGIPNIPAPQPNMQSMMKTVAALRDAVQKLAGKDAGIQNNLTPSKDTKGVQWQEQKRVVEKTKIYQNNDKSSPNWVEVEQINELVMIDKKSGQTWTWKRKK